ncbi:MSMEG_0570 family nitrogen starvation response protein [Bordetella genomosp. 11]|uniref:MSMEG_0570 family nitrogen starvation response protein n=1 Tax=Bordetella genomosp. 11 TaxID=1416808 RepID=A0A261UNF2_9BORD|nr:MSMEG_0570 family nitrogen starvation response protein [Bordetella genomosp. 11]OZI62443.1 hypothetical protein CAL28_25030 [Bordetella genomosp. 11]
MPAMHFLVRWPDGSETECYSPSLVIKDYFVPGTAYEVDDFMSRVRIALEIASERVRLKFGFACSRAADQLEILEARGALHTNEPGRVTVVSFSDAP